MASAAGPMSDINESPDRALWAAVLLQVQDDIASEPLHGIHFAAAEAFVTAPGQWATARADIASCLDLHVDDIQRGGRQWLAARRVTEGLPIDAPLHPVVAKAKPIPLPPAPPVAILLIAAKPLKTRHERGHLRHVFNPFNPLLRSRR